MAFAKVTGEDINIIDTYKTLMEASLGEQSAYLRAKETVEDLVSNANLTGREKAEIVSNTIGQIATSITTQAMEMAYKIKVENRDAPYALAKLKADVESINQQTINASKDYDIKAQQVEQAKQEIINSRVHNELLNIESKMKYDLAITNSGIAVATAGWKTDVAKGTKYDMYLLNRANAYGKAYSEIASSFRANGNLTVQVTDSTLELDGFTTLSPTVSDPLTGEGDLGRGHVYQQTRIAKRNVEAFDDNKYQHVINAASSFLALGASSPNLAGAYNDVLGMWKSSVHKINPDADCS